MSDERRDFDRRLDEMNKRHGRGPAQAPEDGGPKQGWGLAAKLGSEFVAAIIVGLAIGFGFDWALGTTPWGLVFFLLIGFAAATLNVLRSLGHVAPSKLNRDGAEGSDPEA